MQLSGNWQLEFKTTYLLCLDSATDKFRRLYIDAADKNDVKASWVQNRTGDI